VRTTTRHYSMYYIHSEEQVSTEASVFGTQWNIYIYNTVESGYEIGQKSHGGRNPMKINWGLIRLHLTMKRIQEFAIKQISTTHIDQII
jgi:hypothetical protein